MDDLAKRLACGEPPAFAELYDRCADRCHHYLCNFLGSRDAADEVLQETFVRLVRNRDRLAGVENLVAYVFAVARNEAVRHAEKRARDQKHHASLSAADLFLDDSQQRDTAEAVARGLQSLPDDQREVVELKIYGGLTFREIGDVTHVPLQTAATRYRAALDRLKEWFARQPS